MNAVLTSVSTWLHALATVIFIGYFVLMALIFLPAAAKSQPETAAGAILGGVSRRSRYWMYAALLVFFATGFELMLVDPNYLGLGKFSNPWCILMLVKHVLILAMIAAGFWYNAFMRIGPMLSAKSNPAEALKRFRVYINGMAVSGVIVLLLTAVSQME